MKFKVTKLFSKTHHILHRPIGENKWECEQHHHLASFEPFTVGLTSAIPSICTVCFQLNILTGRTSSEVSTYPSYHNNSHLLDQRATAGILQMQICPFQVHIQELEKYLQDGGPNGHLVTQT